MDQPSPGTRTVRLAEVVGMLALGQDAAFGQPLESQLRGTLLACRLADAAGLDPRERSTAYWAGLLRYLGCTGHAHEVADFFSDDDIAVRARSLRYDAARPREALADLVRHAAPSASGVARYRAKAAAVMGGPAFAELNYRTGCEVGDALAERLGMDDAVREALRTTFERWNGKGQPRGVSRDGIPVAMRVVQLAHDLEVLSRHLDPVALRAEITRRAGTSYDPALVPVALSVLGEGLDPDGDPWDAVMSAEPGPVAVVPEARLDDVLTVVADFADLKSVFTGGHSRSVAALAADAAAVLGLDDVDGARARRSALVHDLGRSGVATSVWDKPGPLTRAETDRVRLHPALTRQMLARAPALAELLEAASCHHEQPDGAGYPGGARGDGLSRTARIVGAADRYAAMTQERAHRAALTADEAAVELRRMAAAGQVDATCAEAVLQAAGHRARRRAVALPAGLTEREAEVLRLLAQGLTTREAAGRLHVSPKTVDTHVQHIYAKIGCSTRGAAALFAVRHGLMP